MDTIFALASAPGKAGVSVIRISGADAMADSRPHNRAMDVHLPSSSRAPPTWANSASKTLT